MTPMPPQRVLCDELSTEPFLPLRRGCVSTNQEVCMCVGPVDEGVGQQVELTFSVLLCCVCATVVPLSHRR